MFGENMVSFSVWMSRVLKERCHYQITILLLNIFTFI